MKTYYFGCFSEPGHFLYDEEGRRKNLFNNETPWRAKLDAALCPGAGKRLRTEQRQSAAALHKEAGWTAISMWDRTGDERYNSNSTFIAEGEHSFEDMVRLFERVFPAQYARITAAAPITLVENGTP